MSWPLIIIGMHRSGTSLLARALEELGVFMGHRLDCNHEARFFRKLNDWALRQANASWDYPLPFKDLTPIQLLHIERVFRQHVHGIRRFDYLGPRMGLCHGDIGELQIPWGWKDPRNTFLAKVWLRIFPHSRIIHLYRHPIDVAVSLRAREERHEKEIHYGLMQRFDELRLKARPLYGESTRVRQLRDGVQLWHEYWRMARSLRSPELGIRLLEVRFETLVDEPLQTLRAILDFLDLEHEEEKIRGIAGQVDRSRKFSYFESPELRRLATTLPDRELMRSLGYDHPVLE